MGINKGIIRQRVRVIVDVIAALAFGKLAMTKKEVVRSDKER